MLFERVKDVRVSAGGETSRERKTPPAASARILGSDAAAGRCRCAAPTLQRGCCRQGPPQEQRGDTFVPPFAGGGKEKRRGEKTAPQGCRLSPGFPCFWGGKQGGCSGVGEKGGMLRGDAREETRGDAPGGKLPVGLLLGGNPPGGGVPKGHAAASPRRRLRAPLAPCRGPPEAEPRLGAGAGLGPNSSGEGLLGGSAVAPSSPPSPPETTRPEARSARSEALRSCRCPRAARRAICGSAEPS